MLAWEPVSDMLLLSGLSSTLRDKYREGRKHGHLFPPIRFSIVPKTQPIRSGLVKPSFSRTASEPLHMSVVHATRPPLLSYSLPLISEPREANPSDSSDDFVCSAMEIGEYHEGVSSVISL